MQMIREKVYQMEQNQISLKQKYATNASHPCSAAR